MAKDDVHHPLSTGNQQQQQWQGKQYIITDILSQPKCLTRLHMLKGQTHLLKCNPLEMSQTFMIINKINASLASSDQFANAYLSRNIQLIFSF